MIDITRKVLVASLLFAYLLISCSPGNKSISTSLPVLTFQSPPSPTLPVVEFTPTVSAATQEVQKLQGIVFSPCLAVSPEPPGSNRVPWLLLVQRKAIYYSFDPNGGLILDELFVPPDPGSNSPLAYDFSLSPDGKWLAYVLSDENDDVVVEPSGNLLTKSSQGRIVWRPEKPFQLQGWLNNESVVILRDQGPDKFASTLIRNPFKEEEHEFFLEELPDYLDYQPGGIPGAMLFAHSNLMPDPTLKRLVYPTVRDNDYYRATLWDLENKKVVTSLKLYFDWINNDPLWSLDGSDFLIMGIDEKGQEEWFQVTRDGFIRQLTHFGEFLKDASLGSASRSPDGRYLAFKLYYNLGQDGTYKDRKYLILDLKSQSLDGFCIDSGKTSNPEEPLAWSPGSQYLAITDGIIEDKSAVVILVDLEKRNAFQIGKDVEAIGWMVKP